MTSRHALRSLLRTPVFTIAVLLSLVLGTAAVGSMFAVVYGVLLAPLPYGEPERLVRVSLQTAELGDIRQPPAVYFTYKQHAQSIEDVGFYRTGSTNAWIEGDGKAADSVIATWVTASMVPLLQVPPLLGRTFTADEEFRGGPNAVILSESEWRSRFGAAPDVIGKTLMVNSVARQVVGVMPARFSFPAADTRLWLPVKHTDSAAVEDFSYWAVARLAPGATVAQAQRELATILPRMAESFSRLDSGSSTATWLDEVKPTPVVLPLREAVTSRIAQTLLVLAAAAALVLLVAWANVANLMLIRADGRQLELAVRETLGASHLRMATHFLGEALLLGATAGALALLIASAAVRALVAFGPADVPRLAGLGVGLPTAGFIVFVAALGVLICAAVPAIRVRRALLASKLRDGGRGESAGKGRQRLRASITVVQIALALVVSVGSALLLRTAQRLSEVHPGFDASDVTIFSSQLPTARYDQATSVTFYAQLTERVRELPSVREAGLSSHIPLGSGKGPEQTFRVGGEGRTLRVPVHMVDGGYFAAMKIPLLAGRVFRPLAEERGDDILISRRTAATFFGDPSGAAVVGRRMTLAPSGLSYTVIGVVDDVRDFDLTTAPSPVVYRPHVVPIDPRVEPGAKLNLGLVVRSSGSPDAVVAAIRQIVRELDPTVAVYNVQTMSDVVRASTARLSLVLTLITVAAAISLLLGAIGLYGVMAYMVALRTREFGVRIALGANPRLIALWVARHGLTLTAGGVAAGFVLYSLAAPSLSAFLYGVTTTDPATLVGATLVLAATASLASWLPARRAARVDPVVALRAE
jgi:predicted permease